MDKRLTEFTSKITAEIRRYIRDSASDLTDEEVQIEIERMILSDESAAGFDVAEKASIGELVFLRTRRELSILDKLLADEDISEVMVNGPDDIFVERRGRLERASLVFENTEELENVIRKIAAKVHREVNELSPILDARLADGSRVNAVYKNIALGGPSLTIRRFPKSRITMDDLLKFGTITEEASVFLLKLVQSGYNIFISGGTSSGKTTFLNVLSNYIPKNERIVTIEDSAELQITGVSNIVRLECRNGSQGGGQGTTGEVNMKQLIKASLRMRPNRIIVGEVRGEEVLDMIQAMNTGHDGSLSTGHGNSTEGMLYRLEAMFLQAADFPLDAIRRQIAEGIDIMVHLGRTADGSRRVLEISEVLGILDGQVALNRLFAFSGTEGLVRTENELRDTERLVMRGLVA
ncbi:MAG: Flp pilus assembly complex ATPase component TadA [Clostridiales Family XIII bacterium]|jgi:pilus assembly protein CpaF|nr:Flp pilus assembly complex ATPase component TadA [Clostridiales Family XIII bacterium]